MSYGFSVAIKNHFYFFRTRSKAVQMFFRRTYSPLLLSHFCTFHQRDCSSYARHAPQSCSAFEFNHLGRLFALICSRYSFWIQEKTNNPVIIDSRFLDILCSESPELLSMYQTHSLHHMKGKTITVSLNIYNGESEKAPEKGANWTVRALKQCDDVSLKFCPRFRSSRCLLWLRILTILNHTSAL